MQNLSQTPIFCTLLNCPYARFHESVFAIFVASVHAKIFAIFMPSQIVLFCPPSKFILLPCVAFYDYSISCSIFLASLPSLLLPYFFTIFVPSFWYYCMFHVLLPLPSNCPLAALLLPSLPSLCPLFAHFVPLFCPLCALFLPFLHVSCVVAIALFLPSFCPLLQV